MSRSARRRHGALVTAEVVDRQEPHRHRLQEAPPQNRAARSAIRQLLTTVRISEISGWRKPAKKAAASRSQAEVAAKDRGERRGRSEEGSKAQAAEASKAAPKTSRGQGKRGN